LKIKDKQGEVKMLVCSYDARRLLTLTWDIFNILSNDDEWLTLEQLQFRFAYYDKERVELEKIETACNFLEENKMIFKKQDGRYGRRGTWGDRPEIAKTSKW
jgi:hypothetical protein